MRLPSLTDLPVKTVTAVIALVVVTGCSTHQDVTRRTDGINDPYEPQNRKVHAFNKAIDRGIYRPASNGYAAIIPSAVRGSVNNFSDNLAMPSMIVNRLLQGNIKEASIGTFSFLLNSTVGIGGLIDASGEFRVPDIDTDFGETLAVWGVGEGAYVEVPVFGPSTQRDAVGLFVDFFTNPLSYQLESPEEYYPPAAGILARLNDRARFGDTVDSILYDSVDSYAQARSIYLQNRRFTLGSAITDDLDPYSDPYEDPYAQ